MEERRLGGERVFEGKLLKVRRKRVLRPLPKEFQRVLGPAPCLRTRGWQLSRLMLGAGVIWRLW